MMAWKPQALIVGWLWLVSVTACLVNSGWAQQSAHLGTVPRASRLPVPFVQLAAAADSTRPLVTDAPVRDIPVAARDSGGSSDATAPIPLPPPRSATPSNKPSQRTPAANVRHNTAWVVTSSLAIVLGLFLLVVWLSRRAMPRAGQTLPTDALEVLGRAPLATRHNLQLLRLGHRLLLVSVSPDNARTLLEITDTDEVNNLIAICKQNQPGSITASFRQVLEQMGTAQ